MTYKDTHKFDFSLYLVTDRGYSGDRQLRNIVARAVEGGVTTVQLREKDCSTREFIRLAKQLQNVLRDKNIPLIINDRLDVAMAVQAEGVHLGQNDMPVEVARKILGNNYIIGLSVENMEQLEEAEKMDVDYLGLSPLFTTETKPELKHEWGLKGLQRARQNSSHKIVAIGNIDANNARAVIKSGADGIAVVSAICAAANPQKAAAELSNQIKNVK